eukprot:83837-Amorphochlora_amoeboformis.AAC.1
MVQKGLNSEHFMTVGALSIQSRSLLGRRGFGNGDGEGMGTVGRRAKSMARARGRDIHIFMYNTYFFICV